MASIDFVANVTLNSSGTAAVIAANTVTIENGVVVTIAGSTSANVFTNVPNYSARAAVTTAPAARLLGRRNYPASGMVNRRSTAPVRDSQQNKLNQLGREEE